LLALSCRVCSCVLPPLSTLFPYTTLFRSLHGIPISLKDNIYTKDVRTTAGSKILKDFVPEHDATVVAELKEAGAVVLGNEVLEEDRKSTRLNSSHGSISYAVFCLQTKRAR